jgi:hypothetical protein
MENDTLRQLFIDQAWLVQGPDFPEIVRRYQHDPDAPLAGMSRERLCELAEQAVRDGDRQRWWTITRHILDSLPDAERDRLRAALQHVPGLLEQQRRHLGRWLTSREHVELLGRTFDFVTATEDAD